MALLVEPKVIVRRLTPTSQGALSAASVRAMNARCYEITVEHLLAELVSSEDGDTARILHHFGQDRQRLLGRLEKYLGRLRTGNAGKPSFEANLFQWMEDAWTVASLEQDVQKLRSGALILQFIQNPSKYTGETFTELEELPRLDLKKDFDVIVQPSKETAEVTVASASTGGGEGPGVAAGHGGANAQENLKRFCQNMTQRARNGEIDPVFGRHSEIRQLVDILSRRRKNNPIVVGEPGVGKSALIEGLALAIVAGDVPDHLKNIELLSLDLGALQAGAGVKGEFENRLKNVINEVKASVKPIVLFIDEAHTIIGAGGAQGGSDAANLLKPALARGELRTIAATTWAEYKKYFERDAALERRFQPVKVEEPSEDNAVLMLRGLRGLFEKVHNVTVLDEAIISAVKLSARYISGRLLPDKAVDLLDTATARVKTDIDAKHDDLTSMESDLAGMRREQDGVSRDKAHGFKVDEERLAELTTKIAAREAEITEFQARWSAQRDAVKAVLAARAAFTALKPGEDPAPATQALADANAVWDAMRAAEKVLGRKALVNAEVNTDVVARIVGDWTGIPVGQMQKDDVAVLLSLEDRLRGRVKGQDHAMQTVGETIRISKAGINNPTQPIGVLLFVGPSGVGKTETALTLAEALYGGERFMTTINMSEFQEKHTVSRLIGSPPGYVGYGEGGVLTEAVRQRPYSVVLLDEVEKADLEVMNLFYQVFDKGALSDGEGRHINFRNTIIILTSNLATDDIMKLYDADEEPSIEDVVAKIRPVLSKHFKPALLARMTVIPYRPINRSIMREITALRLSGLSKRLMTSHKIETKFAEELVDEITRRCTEAETGARNVEHILRGSLIPAISRQLLEAIAGGDVPRTLDVGLSPTGDWRIEFSS